MTPPRPRLVRQSLFTSGAAALAVASGLLLDIAIAAVFGAGRSTDAFFVAARIPLGLLAILTVGANQALVPAFATWNAQRDAARTALGISRVLTATVLVATIGAAVLATVAWPLMRVTAPGLTTDQIDMAASIYRVMIAIVPLVAASEVLRAMLQSHYRTVGPTALGVLLSGGAAAVVITRGAYGVHVIAWGYLLGATLQLLLLGVLARRIGWRYRPTLGLRHPDVVEVARLSARPLLAAGANPLARIGEQFVASFLPPGSITLLNYGYRLISAIGGAVFFRAVMASLVPRLTHATASGDRPQVSGLVSLGVRLMLAIALPLTALLAILARPAVTAVFTRGSLTAEDTRLLGIVLAVYAASLLGSGVQRALLAPFFARLDTRTPLRNTIYGVLTNVVLVPVLLLPMGTGSTLAIVAIPVAYSVAQYVNVGHAWYRLRRIVDLPVGRLARFGGLVAVVAGTSAVVMWAGTRAGGLADPALDRATLLTRTALVALAGVTVIAPGLHLAARGQRTVTIGAETGSGAPAGAPDPSPDEPISVGR